MPGPAPDPSDWTIVSFVDADEAIAAAAAHLGPKSLLLVPPAGAACYLGLDWFRHLQSKIPDTASLIIDCGDDPTIAFEALGQGFKHVVFAGDDGYRAELERFTAHQGAMLYQYAMDERR